MTFIRIGKYSLTHIISSGSSSKVTLGFDSEGRLVAIKSLINEKDPIISTNEAFTLQSYSPHPNLVCYLDKFYFQGTLHIVMEYSGRDNLLEYVNRNGPLGESVSRKLFLGIFYGIEHLHNSGIIHRDLKCENVLLTFEMKPVICDLGYATFWNKDYYLEEYCGSLQYAAPEILLKRKYIGPEIDLWSLAVVLYAMLAGRLPWGSTVEEIITYAIQGNYIEIPGLSTHLQTLLDNVLQPEPWKRWNSEQIRRCDWLNRTPKTIDLSPKVEKTNDKRKRRASFSQFISQGFKGLINQPQEGNRGGGNKSPDFSSMRSSYQRASMEEVSSVQRTSFDLVIPKIESEKEFNVNKTRVSFVEELPKEKSNKKKTRDSSSDDKDDVLKPLIPKEEVVKGKSNELVEIENSSNKKSKPSLKRESCTLYLNQRGSFNESYEKSSPGIQQTKCILKKESEEVSQTRKKKNIWNIMKSKIGTLNYNEQQKLFPLERLPTL